MPACLLLCIFLQVSMQPLPACLAYLLPVHANSNSKHLSKTTEDSTATELVIAGKWAFFFSVSLKVNSVG
jgi:hypothetical protein